MHSHQSVFKALFAALAGTLLEIRDLGGLLLHELLKVYDCLAQSLVVLGKGSVFFIDPDEVGF